MRNHPLGEVIGKRYILVFIVPKEVIFGVQHIYLGELNTVLSFIQRFVTRGMRVFLLVWFGQMISLIGSGLTGFALGIWVYQRTGSATQFALIYLFAMLPQILMSPIAGALVDRWNRRWAMILSDTGAAVSTLAIALLAFTEYLEIWHIYLAVAISSTFSAFQWPAYSAAITLLVPKRHFARVSGMTQLGQAVAHIISPVLGGILLVTIQLQGVILLDLVTFIFALVTLLLVRFPEVKTTVAESAKKNGLLREIWYGWHYLKDRPGLLGLLILFAINNFVQGIVTTLFTPFALSFTSVTVLGTFLSIGGLGMLMGSLVMSTWGGPKRLIYGVFGFLLLEGVCILMTGLPPVFPILAVLIFIYFFSVPFFVGCKQAILQRKVAPEVQGRVFAMERMIAWSFLPLAYLVAGPLADYVFEPLMTPNGYLAGSLGPIIGVGQGRGIALLFIMMGALIILATIVAYQSPRLRRVEDELPDAVADS